VWGSHDANKTTDFDNISRAFPRVFSLNIVGGRTGLTGSHFVGIRKLGITCFDVQEFDADPLRMISFPELLAYAHNVEELDISSDKHNLSVGGLWPFEPYREEEQSDRILTPRMQFTKLMMELKQCAPSLNPQYLSELRRLRLTDLELDLSSLCTICRNLAGEGEDQPCLITTRKCQWYRPREATRSEDMEYGYQNVPNVTEMEWYNFLQLAYSTMT